MSLNKVFLMGNLTRDPELKQAGDSQVAEFGIAVNEKRGDREETLFADIQTWGKTAEICAKYLRKGSQVVIEGRLKLDTWQAQDGRKMSRMRIVAENIQFVGGVKTK